MPAPTDHEFWATQPVPQTPAQAVSVSGPLEEADMDRVCKTPLPLPSGLVWQDLDIMAPEGMNELVTFLHDNYVADADGEFAFDYSSEVLNWALLSPLARKFPQFSVGVRSESGELMGYINGAASEMDMAGQVVRAIKVDFLCVHMRLRGTRLAPTLIAEIKRRANCNDIWQAVYTGAQLIPTPLTVCSYFHRILNVDRAVALDFYEPTNHMTVQSAKRMMALPPPRQSYDSFEKVTPLVKRLVPAVRQLVEADLQRQRSALSQHFSADVDFFFEYRPRPGVVVSLVGLDADGAPVSFGSFTVINNFRRDLEKKSGMSPEIGLRTAYLNGVFVDPRLNDGSADTEAVARREMVLQLLYEAQRMGADVFNALDISRNTQFLRNLGFQLGTGRLHYYVFNYGFGRNVQSRDIALVLA